MSEAIRDMVAILLQTPAWKPDRATAAQIRQCSACKSWKHIDHFSPSDHLCRPCRKTLSRTNRRKASGKWAA